MLNRGGTLPGLLNHLGRSSCCFQHFKYAVIDVDLSALIRSRPGARRLNQFFSRALKTLGQ